MAKERNAPLSGDKCQGGKSFGCKHDEHPRSVKHPEILCYRCQTFLGCGSCAQRNRELLCLHCHNWGSREGLYHHGNIVPNAKVPNVLTDEGWKHWDKKFNVEKEVDKLVRNPPF